MEHIKQFNIFIRVIFITISIIISTFDQISKFFVKKNIIFLHQKITFSHLKLTLIYNNGAAFSLLTNNQHEWQIILLSFFAFIISIIIFYILFFKKYNIIFGIALSFILGGTIGNLIDRILYHKVTDFIDLYIDIYHWPIFNIADFFISLGLFILVIKELLKNNYLK